MAAPEIDSADGIKVGGVLMKDDNVGRGAMTLSCTVLWTDDGVGVSLGTIPNGSFILDIMVDGTTDFTDSGTNLFSIGIPASHGRYVSGLNVDAATLHEPTINVATWGYISSATEIFAYYEGSNNNATEGEAKAVILYVVL
jgi:hypothetical protein